MCGVLSPMIDISEAGLIQIVKMHMLASAFPWDLVPLKDAPSWAIPVANRWAIVPKTPREGPLYPDVRHMVVSSNATIDLIDEIRILRSAILAIYEWFEDIYPPGTLSGFIQPDRKVEYVRQIFTNIIQDQTRFPELYGIHQTDNRFLENNPDPEPLITNLQVVPQVVETPSESVPKFEPPKLRKVRYDLPVVARVRNEAAPKRGRPRKYNTDKDSAPPKKRGRPKGTKKVSAYVLPKNLKSIEEVLPKPKRRKKRFFDDLTEPQTS